MGITDGSCSCISVKVCFSHALISQIFKINLPYTAKAVAEWVYKSSSALILPQLCRVGTDVLERLFVWGCWVLSIWDVPF